MRESLLWGMVFLALLTVNQVKVFHGVLMRLALSISAVGAYFVLMAPDVALTEGMIGALLMTYVYILLVRSPNVIKVGFLEKKILFEKRPVGYDGLQYQLLKNFSHAYGYSMEIIKYNSEEELLEALKNDEIDVACGGIFEGGIPILPTKLFKLKNGEVKDFISMKNEDFENVVETKDAYYTILFKEHGEEFLEFLKDLKDSGEYERIVRKYAG